MDWDAFFIKFDILPFTNTSQQAGVSDAGFFYALNAVLWGVFTINGDNRRKQDMP